MSGNKSRPQPPKGYGIHNSKRDWLVSAFDPRFVYDFTKESDREEYALLVERKVVAGKRRSKAISPR